MIKFVKSAEGLPTGAVQVQSGEYAAVIEPVMTVLESERLLEAVGVMAQADPLTWRQSVPLGDWLGEIREGDLEYAKDVLALISSGDVPAGEKYELTDDDRCRFLGSLLKRMNWDGSVAIVGVQETERELDTDPKSAFYGTLRGALRVCWNAGVDIWVVGTWLRDVLERDARFCPFLERL